MNNIINFLERRFVPVAGRIGSQRHLVSIRDGFIAIMPLIMAGSIAVLINNFPIPAFQDLMTGIFGDSWKSFGGNIWNGTFAIMSLILVFTIAYSLSKFYDSDPLAAATVAFASLMTLTQSAAEAWAIPYAWTGAQGLFVTIIVALISTEIFTRLLNNPKLIIKMPDGVPPAVSKSFAALFPGLITVMIFAVLKIITTKIGIVNIHEAVFNMIQGPLSSLGQSLGSAIAIAFTVHFLWFFGLHGTNMLEPIMQGIYLPPLEANIQAFQTAGVAAAEHIVTKPFFDVFVYMGGAGTSIGLIIAIFLASKRKLFRDKAKLAAGPGIFNINEPVMFGMPIVLNPAFLIPFVLVPVILTITSYLAISTGLVPKTVALVPWTFPPIISGYLVTGGSIMGSLLQVVNLVIAIAIYLPFIKIAERLEDKKLNKVTE